MQVRGGAAVAGGKKGAGAPDSAVSNPLAAALAASANSGNSGSGVVQVWLC
jgi:hypothetical protein